MPSETFESWWCDFRDTGDICPITLGCSRDELRAVLGPPDETGGNSRKYRTSAIWKYGDLEFHFGPKSTDVLWLIYMENDEGIVVVSIPRQTEYNDGCAASNG